MKRKNISKEEALLAMADLCARSEQCEFDIVRKLRLKMLPMSSIFEIIDYLKENRYIDADRYASGFANDKVRFSAWGRLKIRAALIAKKIPSHSIQTALDNIDESDYADALRRAVNAKIRSVDLNVYEDRMKMYRYLMSRGFESALIGRALKALMKN